MPYSTVERVDCMVAEQYNVSSLRGESTLSTERSGLAGAASGDRRHNGELVLEPPKRYYGRSAIFNTSSMFLTNLNLRSRRISRGISSAMSFLLSSGRITILSPAR